MSVVQPDSGGKCVSLPSRSTAVSRTSTPQPLPTYRKNERIKCGIVVSPLPNTSCGLCMHEPILELILFLFLQSRASHLAYLSIYPPTTPFVTALPLLPCRPPRINRRLSNLHLVQFLATLSWTRQPRSIKTSRHRLHLQTRWRLERMSKKRQDLH